MVIKNFYKIGLLFILFFNNHLLFAQKENNIWMMSFELPNHNSGIDFNSGSPDTFAVYRDLSMFLTNASICDTNGQLLFYTNGCRINNRNHDTLFNSDGFNPGWLTNYYQPDGMGLPQGMFVIPKPGNYGQYYLFHESGELVLVDSHLVSQPINLSYCIIDMALDSGRGGIVDSLKNIPIINDTLIYGRLTGVKHGNGRDWWVLAHRSDSDLYYTLLITPDTILGPFSQNIGSFHRWEKLTQQAVFSPTGDKYAIELTVDKQTLFNVIDLFDFDRCSGMLSNFRSITVPDSFSLALGCSFSPNGRYLYVSTSRNIYQYDTWIVNVDSTVKHVAEWDSFVSPAKTIFYYHLLAPDGKIYITTVQASNVLHYINDPDQPDTLCNVIQNSFFLPALNNFCMPNAPNYGLGKLMGSNCDTLGAGIAEFHSNDFHFEVFPNPTSGNEQVTFEYILPNNKEGILDVFDINMRKVYSARLSSWSNVHITRFNMPAAMYYARITSGIISSALKIIIEGEN
jgi:hypothetical protein